jgi:hypothetical protein
MRLDKDLTHCILPKKTAPGRQARVTNVSDYMRFLPCALKAIANLGKYKPVLT